MRYAHRLSVTEAVTVEPLSHARNGVADTPPISNLFNDNLCGGKKIVRQICDEFSGLLFAEMTIRATIFRRKFLTS
uniref:Uncharacterized protein n=1 Tax=Bracon brevicornis TaxID=1563983 RepID=A0A6V7KIQ7_9HYME